MNSVHLYNSIINSNQLPIVENENGYIDFIPESLAYPSEDSNIDCMLIGNPTNNTFIICDKFYYDSSLSEYDNLELLIDQCYKCLSILVTIPSFEDIQ